MPCAVMSAHSPSTAQHIQGENLARFAFRNDLERPATDLAVRRELLRGLAGVDHQLEALPAKGALHSLGQLHPRGLQPTWADSATSRRHLIKDRSRRREEADGPCSHVVRLLTSAATACITTFTR